MREATAHLQEAVAHDPYHRRAYELLAPLLFVQGRIDEMRVAVEKVKLISPNSLGGLIAQVVLLAHDGDLPGALRLCDGLEPAFGPDGAQLARLLARLLASCCGDDLQWRTTPNVGDLVLIARIAPLLPNLFGKPGEAHGKRPGARSDVVVLRLRCFRGLARELDFSDLSVARLSSLLTDPRGMADRFARLARDCPNGAFDYAYASARRDAGEKLEAEQAYRRVLATPSFLKLRQRARFELVRLLRDRAKESAGPTRWELENEARQHLRRLIAAGGYPTWAAVNLAHFAGELDEDGAALTAVEEGLRQSPGDARALKAATYLEFKLGAFERCAATLDEMIRNKPDSADLLNQKGVAQYQGGDKRGALASFLEALKHQPDDGYARGNLGNVERALQQRRVETAILLEKLRLREALLLAHRGDHAAAVAAADPLPPSPRDGDARIAVACVYALAAKAASGPLAERYAASAVAELRRAKEDGYFKDQFRVQFLDGEHDLDPIQQRPAFLALRKEIAAK